MFVNEHWNHWRPLYILNSQWKEGASDIDVHWICFGWRIRSTSYLENHILTDFSCLGLYFLKSTLVSKRNSHWLLKSFRKNELADFSYFWFFWVKKVSWKPICNLHEFTWKWPEMRSFKVHKSISPDYP